MVVYSFDRNFTQEQAETLFLAVDWESGRYPERLYKALMHSETILTASTEEIPLAGLMSAVSDGGMNVYFPYLLVHPAAQHRNIGRTLVKMMLSHYEDYCRKILVCPDHRVQFYQSAGWQKACEQTAMLICTFPSKEECNANFQDPRNL